MMQNFNYETIIFCFHNHRDYAHFMQGFGEEYAFFFRLAGKKKKGRLFTKPEARPCYL
jgi:hypothetical protein